MIHRTATLAFLLLLISIGSVTSCSAQTESQALEQLRQMTADGKLPPEATVASIESRFSGKRTGALAKLLHARIKFENKDYAGAAQLLASDVFARLTKVADHALWLRGQAFEALGSNAEAARVFEELIKQYPTSIRARDAKLHWAAAAMLSGRAVEVPPMLVDLLAANDGDALAAAAKAYEAQNSPVEALKLYRRAYFFAAGTDAATAAGAKLTAAGQPLDAVNADEQLARADRQLKLKNYSDAANAFSDLALKFPAAMNSAVRLRALTAYAGARRMTDAQSAFAAIPPTAPEREDAFRQIVLGFAGAKMWAQARSAADEMKAKFPASDLTAKTFVDAGLAARDARSGSDEMYFLNTAVAAFPMSAYVASAQFEAAWSQHEAKNFDLSSRMLIEHLARYADKDTTNRGKAGYWSARDAERAGKIADACALYDATDYRYGSNWYGYLALSRLTALKANGNCRSNAPVGEDTRRAVANLRLVTVAPETAGPNELERAEKSDELSVVGLFDWAIDELNEARRTAPNSPKINLALARHYRWKGQNVQALIAMQKSYPDYAQMFPEEMGREEWSFFYPLTNWPEIERWSSLRGLDPYQIAGFIRQETVFDPRARSGANAYGLMQLLLPTAKSVARKYSASVIPSSPEDLYRPDLNIELGTAFLKDQFAKFGRVEYVAVAYNAGPGRVPQWRATLPPEIDDFVEEIPFRETKQYVQGIIRNTAQYRRLYDDNGNFKANVGTRPLRGEIDSKSSEQFAAENPDVVISNAGE